MTGPGVVRFLLAGERLQVAASCSKVACRHTAFRLCAVRDGSVSGGFGRQTVRSLFLLRADAELYRQRCATGQIPVFAAL
jgi:hypothetical protein